MDRRGFPGVAILALFAAACGSGSSAPTGGPAVTVGIEHNGGSVHLVPGQHLSVVLKSTYWELSLPAPGGAVLSVLSSTVVPGGAGCEHTVMGSGCGTATIALRARHPGTATVVGSRSTCGEALRCSPAEGSYELRVVVGP